MTFLSQGNKIMVSYIWLGTKNALCSKDRVLEFEPREASEVPPWSFGDLSEGVRVDLQPVIVIRDPFRPGAANKIVFCETHVNDKFENAKTSRVKCKLAMEKLKEHHVWCGIQQPFTIINTGCTPPGGVATNGEALKRGAFPALDWGSGREVVEKFNAACLYAGVAISASHASRVASNFVVELTPMPGVAIADHLWLARYILLRVAEEMKISAIFANSDQLTLSFSTVETRATGGTATIAALVEKYKNMSENGETLRVPMAILERHRGYMCLQRAADFDPYEVVKTVADFLSADEHSHKVHSADDITNKGPRFAYDRQTFENLRPKKPVEPFELRCFPQLAASEAKIPPRIPRMPAPPRNPGFASVPSSHPFGRPQDNGQRGGFVNTANGRQTTNNTFAAGDSTNVLASGGSIFAAMRQQSSFTAVEKPASKPALPSEPPGMQKIQPVVEKKEPVQESSPLPSKTPSLQSVSTAVSAPHVDSITDVEQPVEIKFKDAIVELAAVTSLEEKQDETAKKEEEPVAKKEELPVTPTDNQAPVAEVDAKPKEIEKTSKMPELPATKNKELEPVHDITIIPINAAEVSAKDLNKELEKPSKVAESGITPGNENKETEKQPEEGSAPEKNIDPKPAAGWGGWEPKETSKTEWKPAFGAGFGCFTATPTDSTSGPAFGSGFGTFTATSIDNSKGPAFGGDNRRGGGRGRGSFERGGRGERPPRGGYRGRGESRGFRGGDRGRGGNSNSGGDVW